MSKKLNKKVLSVLACGVLSLGGVFLPCVHAEYEYKTSGVVEALRALKEGKESIYFLIHNALNSENYPGYKFLLHSKKANEDGAHIGILSQSLKDTTMFGCHYEALKIICEFPDIDKVINQDCLGETALSCVLRSGNYHAANLLIDKGADIKKCDKNRNTIGIFLRSYDKAVQYFENSESIVKRDSEKLKTMSYSELVNYARTDFHRAVEPFRCIPPIEAYRKITPEQMREFFSLEHMIAQHEESKAMAVTVLQKLLEKGAEVSPSLEEDVNSVLSGSYRSHIIRHRNESDFPWIPGDDD